MLPIFSERMSTPSVGSDKLNRAKNLRNVDINRLKEILTVAQKAQTDVSFHSQFIQRYKIIDTINDSFSKQHNLICTLLPPDSDQQFQLEDQVRTNFDSNFYSVKAIYYELFEQNQQTKKNESDLPRPKLPELKLIKFNGDVKNFTSFRDVFDALVHNNQQLSNIEKFSHLLASLEGPPKNLVQCYPLTSTNYVVAYNALQNRYSNQRLLATFHWNEIENAPRLNNENPLALRKLLDTFTENVAALKNLQFSFGEWDFVLTHMLLKRLDPALVARFETHHASTAMPSFDSLTDYISKQCTAYETIILTSPAPQSKHKNLPHRSNSFLSTRNQNINNYNIRSCHVCNKPDHLIYGCPILLNKTPYERYSYVKQHKLCINCLSHTHTSENCKSASTCRTCQSRHHSLLHYINTNQTRHSDTPRTFTQTHNTSDNTNQNTNCGFTTQLHSQTLAHHSQYFHTTRQTDTMNKKVLLATLIIQIRDGFGNFQLIRGILDSGSESCYISENCAKRLCLKISKNSINILGLGGMKTNANKGTIRSVIKPFNKIEPLFDVDAIILENICSDMPNCNFDISKWDHIKNINLADPEFYMSRPIDIILGANIFNKILLGGNITAKNLPTAINTAFGYVLMGEISNDIGTCSISHTFFTTAKYNSLENIVKGFWDLEEIPQQTILSPDDKKCEKHYQENTFRLDSGRYVVSLPFKAELPKFENSKLPAVRRFYSLERRLISNPDLQMEYCKIIQEYLDNDQMELTSTFDKNAYYLPHHCVLKTDSVSSPVRIVFDASCKDSNNLSLNETLLTGPKLQKDIAVILLNFRLHSIVMTADIKAMYRQVLINRNHYNFQRILWRFSSNEPLKEYFLKTVTFGVNSSPYLALRTIIQLATDEHENFPLASNILLSDVYVDDIVTGCNSLEEAKIIVSQLIYLLKKGGFELRKWASNNKNILSSLPENLLHTNSLSFDNEERNTIKVLGLKWNPSNDSFSYSVHVFDKPCTKRNMLSELARIYDPLGFLTPVTLYSKLLIQNLWTLKLDWDEKPPQNILNKWQCYQEQLHCISSLIIPRHILNSYNDYETIDLCGFCDGSLAAYSACVYVRITYQNEIKTVLLCAKSKVAPLKRLSIPRIELCGALLLSKLLCFITDTYKSNIDFKNTYAFTDSTVVLHWLNSSPHRWKPFVANRIASIQEKLPHARWLHISSENNIADGASRGLQPAEFVKCSQWWGGPTFLKQPFLDWPVKDYVNYDTNTNTNVQTEERKIALMATSGSDLINNLIEKFSSLEKLKRIFAWTQRFIFNIKNPLYKQLDHLTIHDAQSALLIIIKHIQHEVFSLEIDNFLSKKSLSKPMRKLGAFVDSNGLLRVGGRLTNSLLNYDQKFPIILPRNHRLTDLIIEDVHKRHLHPGLQTTQYLLTQNYWILSPRRAIRKILSKCIKCFRTKPTPVYPIMGNLPASRVTEVKPFSIVGIDFGGPFFLTCGRIRGAKVVKSYICIFVCFATKALHLELVSDLSSENFLCALRRFISRRGRCNEIISDNATNFVGANKYLLQIMKNCASKEKIKWSFNPPYASHFGGLYEAGIKSVKTHLLRIIGNQKLTYEEFNTLIIQIESLLNSRPLCPLSSDPNDYNVLTPGHFLTLQPLTCLPDPDLGSLKINRLDRYQLLLRLHRDFWARWHKEYLHTLQQKSKWTLPDVPVPEGTLVLVKQDNSPPMTWKLARIIKLIKGQDGIARVAEIKTTQGSYIRPLVKLCPLPVS